MGSTVDYGLTYLHGNITPLQGIAVETVLTLLVVLVYIHTTMEGEEKSQKKRQPSTRSVIAPLACGFTLIAAVMSRYVRAIRILFSLILNIQCNAKSYNLARKNLRIYIL